MTETEKTPEQLAVETLQKAQQTRVTAAQAEIAEVCKKYGVALQIQQNIAIVPAQ